jgi:hypothetical protein
MTDLSVAFNSFTDINKGDYNPMLTPRALPSNQQMDISQLQYSAEQSGPRPTPNLNKPALQPEFTPRSYDRELEPISNLNPQMSPPPPSRNPSPMDQLKQERQSDTQMFKEHFNSGSTSAPPLTGAGARSFQARSTSIGELTRSDKVEKQNIQTQLMPNRTLQAGTRPIPPAIINNIYKIPNFTEKEYNQYAFPFIPYFELKNDRAIKSDTRAVENNILLIIIVIAILGMLTYRLIR